MKTMKKVGAIVLALCMCMALCVTAFADSSDSYTITVEPAYSGETYTAYKVFDATYTVTGEDEDAETLVAYTIESTSAWFEQISENSESTDPVFILTQAAGSETTYVVELVDGKEASDIVAVLTPVPEEAEAAATATPTFEANSDGSSGSGYVTLDVTTSGAGYYYVTTTTGSVVSIDSATPEVTIADKNVPPTVTKNVDDTNVESVENEKAVEYELYINNVAGVLNVVLHDNLQVDEGVSYTFDYDNMTVVLYDDTSDTPEATLVAGTDYVLRTEDDNPSTIEDDCTFEVDLSDYDFSDCGADAFVKVTISCVFDAVGATFEDDELEIPNLAQVTFGNGGYSVWDEADIYEYGFEVYKYTEGEGGETIALADAHFTLTNSSGQTAYFAIGEESGAYVLEGWGTIPEGIDYTTDLVSDSNGYILIEGLGVGTFILTETQAPDGYNLLTDSITVVIAADETNPNSFTVTADGAGATGHVVMVENNAGTILPGTGGMGTTIFYVVGAILICGAAVVLITRRRMAR